MLASTIWKSLHKAYRNDFYYIGCNGIRKHADGEFNLPFTVFLIIRNDGLVAKPCHEKAILFSQPVGSFLCLNIHRYHHVIYNRNRASEKWWIAIAKDYEIMPTKDVAIKDFSEFLRRTNFELESNK